MIPEYAKNSKEEIPFAQYMEQYRQMDPKEASGRTGLPYDEEKQCFHLRVLQRDYLVSWPELVVTRLSKDDIYSSLESETAAKILVLRFLLRGVQSHSTGKYLTYREVPSGEVYFRQFSGRCLARLAYGFGFQPEKLNRAFERIGAEKLSHGDVSYRMEIINDYFVEFILWTGDEEFPPSAQMLFSDNFPVSFEPEDLAVVGDISINTLKKL